MRSLFDRQLGQLNEEMIRMGMLCETAIRHSATALLEHDLELASRMPALLEKITQQDREIENICLRLLLQQQPVASDLRTISSALKMVTDMARIGVQSGDIAEIVTMDSIRQVDDRLPIREMTDSVIHMVTTSIDAFVKQDVAMAQSVIDYDDVVDHDFDLVKIRLVDELKEKDADSAQVLDLLMVAKYLERIGDHAVNVAKWVIFSVTGKLGA